MTEAPETRRLFFALWPDAGVARALAQLQHTHLEGLGRPVDRGRIHLTLLFLGAVAADRTGCLSAGAAALSVPSFRLELAVLGGFARSRVTWLAPTAPPEPLLDLAAGLRGVAAGCGLTPEARPFAAHVTLVRKTRGAPPRQTLAPVEWPVREFVLVVSRTLPEGPEYTVLERWSLA